MTLNVFSKDELNEFKQNIISEIENLIANHYINPVPKEWLTIEEACDYLQVSRSTIQNYRRNGVLGFSQINSKIYFRRSDLLAHLEKHYVPGN